MSNKMPLARTLLLLTSAMLIACSDQQSGTDDLPVAGAPQAGSPTASGGSPTGGASTPSARTFKHPGAPLTLADLQTLKTYVDQGKEPWKSGYDQMAGSPYSRLSYGGYGPFAKVSRAPDENLWPWRNDMAAIWNLSRMWYFTRDERYAEHAHALLLGWARTHVEFSGRESMLDLGDYAYQFVGGAEILRGTWPGWTEDDTTTVKKYFKTVLMPAANPYGESMYGAANKGALALVAQGLMAIYDDDTEALDRVVHQTRTLAHIGLRNSNDLGMLGDSLRDQGHAHGQLLSLTMLAEALWTQGIDIYSDFDDRLLSAGEYFARVNELAPTAALPFGTTDQYYTADNTGHGWNGADGGSIALTQLHGAYVLRKGLQAPYIAQRRLWMPTDGSSFMFLKTTDSSRATPPPALPIPQTASITTGFSNAEIGGAAPAGTSAYANGRWTIQGAGNDIFWNTQDGCHFTYKAITGNSAIIAKVESVQDTNPAAVAGVMMRTSLDPGAPRAWMAVAPRGKLEQNMRNLAVYGGSNYGTKALDIPGGAPSYWVKLERVGNIITGYVSPDGTNWAATDVGRINAPVPDTLYVGLVVSSVAKALNTSAFSNVQITGGDGGAPSVVPSPPAMLLASPGDGAVPLRWQASFGATGYTVRRSSSADGPFSTVASGIQGSRYTDKSVTNGATYFYTVTASNAAGTSGSSPMDSATPMHPLLDVATGGSAIDSSNDVANALHAFDQNSGSPWRHGHPTGWLRYDLGHLERVQRYAITSAGDPAPRDPKDWQIQGSNDGATWITLDARSDQAFARRLERKTYAIANPGAYRYYRLDITANNADASTEVGELELLVPDSQ